MIAVVAIVHLRQNWIKKFKNFFIAFFPEDLNLRFPKKNWLISFNFI